MSLQNVFGDLALDSTVQDVVDKLNTGIDVVPSNITGKFRDAFENFTPGDKWTLTQDSNDIVQLDGNAVSASYLAISKDPLTTGGVTTIETVGTYEFPFEIAAGLSMSQRVLGQELSMELVSTEEPLPAIPDMAISSIGSNGTTLYVNTVQPHGLAAGKRVGIYGVTSDSRMNYPSLVVSAIISPTQFYATAGPAGTIASLTVGPYNNQGYVYFRSALGYAQNGVSQIFENASATNASMYARSSAGDALPSGTAGGNHSVTVASTTPTQAIASAYTYSFLPASEYRIIPQADRVQWMDAAIDTTVMPASRLLRTQVVPDSTKQYKLRFRFTNNKGLTVPTAKIVSISKSGTTTATVTTASAHGLTTGDFVALYGIRNGTDFPSGTGTVIQVASTPTSTTFTLVLGSAVTNTSYGGFVARVNGGNVPVGFQGAGSGAAAQTAFTAGLPNELQMTSSGNWGVQVGDYVNLYGLRSSTDGSDMGVDGVYRVVDLATTTIRLAPINGATLPSFTVTNVGGALIRRTDMRLSFARIFDYVRERVEVQATGAQAASVPVAVNGGTISVSSGTINVVNNNSFSLVTSTNLGASATYTQTAVNAASSTTSTTQYNTQLVIGVQHTAGLVPGQLYMDVGTETSSTAPTTWYQSLAVPIPSNANWQYFSVPLSTRYYRLRFVNGATAQTSFRLSTFTTYNGGALSNAYSFPVNIQYPLSVTALAGGATFTGVTMDFGDTMNAYQTITALAFSDQASASNGFKIQLSRDGTNWRDAVTASVTANTLSVITTHLSYRYARVVYTNGATLQGIFNLDAHVDAG